MISEDLSFPLLYCQFDARVEYPGMDIGTIFAHCLAAFEAEFGGSYAAMCPTSIQVSLSEETL